MVVIFKPVIPPASGTLSKKNILLKKILILVLVFGLSAVCSASPDSVTTYGFSLREAPKYQPGFTHFEYVNPDAPKGGTVTMSATGTFDNFHRFAQRGNAAYGSNLIYDRLMTPSRDEVDVYYPLIAEKVEYAKDHTWIIFYVDERARFQDGRPITAEDVVFSFNKFFTQGVSQFKTLYKDVDKVEAKGRLEARFTLKKPNLDLLHSLSTLRILPRHYWQDRDFREPALDVPLGSSMFTIDSYKMGQYVVYKRLKDYWATDLPVNKGRYNFDYIRFDYYKDQVVMLEAFKAGEFDFREELLPKQWATMYTGEAFDKGHIVRETIPHEIPQDMEAFVFNVQRELFKDPRVREALGYAMDFEWMNKHLFYDQYTRCRSYFQNTEYEAKGLPSKGELTVLEPVRDTVPQRLFKETYQPPKTDGTGNIRPQLRKALQLLKKAGWSIKDKKLTHEETGRVMAFELLIYKPSLERVVIPIKANLKRLGVDMTIRKVDISQFINRLRERDFDMISSRYRANAFPSTGLKIVWHTDFLDSTWNTAGVSDPAIDYLVEQIADHQTDKTALLNLGRALDRVLQFNFFVIPQWYNTEFKLAYWNRFSRPEKRPKYSNGFFDTWWIDTEKQSHLPRHKAVN